MFKLRIEWIAVLTAFALSGAPAALGDPSSPVMVVFSVSGSNSPKHATWSGSAWSSTTTLPSVGGNAYWVALRNCPTRNEMACATFDGNADVNAIFHNGASWSSVTEVCTDADETDDSNMDVAYQQNSGQALIVWYDLPSNNLRYRTYNGTSLSSTQTLSRSGIEGNDVISLFPKPNSDQIVLITLGQVSGSSAVISANIWSGSGWLGWTTIESNATTNDDDCFGFAFESLSGDGLLAYGRSGSSQPRYRTLTGTTWSSAASMPSTGDPPKWVALAADPTSDQILFAGLDNSNDINVNAWNGSAWGSNLEVETNAPASDRRGFDLAYEPAGTKALLVYIESGQNRLRYRTWSGSAWSSEQTGTDLGNQGRVVQLRTGRTAGEIFIAASDDGDDLELVQWSGSGMSAKTQIEGSLGGTSLTEPFMIAVPTGSSLVPANIPYFTDFEGPVGPEWSSSTITYNSNTTKFAGRYRTEQLKLALNTTPGETYALTFDFYGIDSWDGNPPPYGPDYFIVKNGGNTLFQHTFIHDSWIANGYSYPNPADQSGHYGWNSSWKDGIYRGVEVVFTANSSVTTLTFTGQLTDEAGQGFNDESWGIDNVRVDASRFVDVSAAKSFNVQTCTDHHKGSSLHWADVDNDGDLDAILTGDSSSRLMRNTNAGQGFVVSTFGGGSVFRQGGFVDLDNDGDMDFWAACVGGYDTEAYFENNGFGTFTNRGAVGLSNPSNNEGLAVADVNGDGWCDVVLFGGVSSGNYIGHNGASLPVALSQTNASTYGLNGLGDSGNGDFVSAGDVNNDNYLDFFYHYGSGKLFLSSGDGTYLRNNRGISVVTGAGGSAADKFGSAWADYDNDGDLDLFVPRVASGSPGYLWQWGTTSFANVAAAAGLNDASSQISCCWGDYDNDGDLDLYVLSQSGNSVLYRNEGNGTFRWVNEGAVIAGGEMDAVFVDYDNDGDLDIAITRLNQPAILLENRTNNPNYLKVRLIGRGAGGTHAAAIGTRVELWDAAGAVRLGRRDIGVARGFGGSEPLWAHFGGFNPANTYQVRVYWRSRAANDPAIYNVVPAATSTTIGSRVIPQMFTAQEPAKVRIVRWKEVKNSAS